MRKTGLWALRLVAGLATLLVGYVLAGVMGAAIPTHREWRQARTGVRIYVVDNGIHSDLVLPVVAAGVDWRPLGVAEPLRDPRMAGHDYVAFGWGDRDFYLNTPRWSDVNPLRVVRAMLGGGATVLHVEHVPAPVAGPDVRSVVLTPDEYARLAAFVRDTFADGPAVPGYFTNDAFHPARRRYSAVHTCNAWTGRALREAGVRMGAWTPFSATVLWWL